MVIHRETPLPALRATFPPGGRLYKECPGCRYRGRLSTTSNASMSCCDYCFITGHARTALPEREDGRCPGFEPGERYIVETRPAAQPIRVVRERKCKYSHAALLAAYNLGLSDGAMGRLVGCDKSTARAWRQRNGLPPNGMLKRKGG